MSEQDYKFKITSRKIKPCFPGMEEDLTIQVSSDRLRASNFHFNLKLNQKQDRLLVQSVTLKVGVSWQDAEIMGYLKGYFGFNEDREIEKAMEELKDSLNDKEGHFDQFDIRWQEFHARFSRWFSNKLKPCLEKEIQLHLMYCSSDITDSN